MVVWGWVATGGKRRRESGEKILGGGRDAVSTPDILEGKVFGKRRLDYGKKKGNMSMS